MGQNRFQIKTSNGQILCQNMKLADDLITRLIGLMFSHDLPDCDGLMLVPCNSIHTFFMRYAIDVVFLDKDLKVVKAIYGIKPFRMTWIYFKAHQVLEMKAGTLSRDLKAGDRLEAICIS